MRLDHLLSKEQAEVETRKLILWSIRLRETRDRRTRSSIKAAKSSAKRTLSVQGNLLKLAPWFCIVFRVYPELHLDNCTREMIQRLGQLQYGVLGTEREKSRSETTYLNVTTIGLRTKRRKNQANKSTGWMPRHHTPRKVVASCDKLRGAASRL